MEIGNPFTAGKDERGIAAIDPASIGGSEKSADVSSAAKPAANFGSGTGGPGKRRGRPPGSKNKTQGESGPRSSGSSTAKAPIPVDRDAISAILLSAHAMLAGIAKAPELALDKNEADALAEATAKVAEMYDLSADPKVIAWSNLAMTVGMIYGTRFIAINTRKKEERAKRREKVVPINGAGFTPGKLPDFDGGFVPPVPN